MARTIAGIGFVYVIATLGRILLGSTIVSRTEDQHSTLRKEVGQLWGGPRNNPKSKIQNPFDTTLCLVSNHPVGVNPDRPLK